MENLIWYGHFIFAIVAFAVAFVWKALLITILPYKRKRSFLVNNCHFIGLFLAGVSLFIPLYTLLLSDEPVRWLASLFASVQHSFRMFALDGGYMEFIESVQPDASQSVGAPEWALEWYPFAILVLYAVAPFLTFTFLLSFFKNLWAHVRYCVHPFRPAHVFSELNERSLALAKSIRYCNKKDKRDGRNCVSRFFFPPLIVFSNVPKTNEEEAEELVEEAKEIGAILFFKDMESVRYRFRYSPRKVYFYLMEENEADKVRRSDKIISDYKKCKGVHVYVFSDNIETKLFFEAYSDKEKSALNIEVVRVNEIRSLIYHNLDGIGTDLFRMANRIDSVNREISAVIIGLGRYGSETLKALLWYSQIPGYRIKINAFDERADVVEYFRSMCPDIDIQTPHDESGDMRYTVNIESAKFGTREFNDKISAITDATYVFIGLGNDRNNISAATVVRGIMLSKNCNPHIDTVIYDTVLKNKMEDDNAKEKKPFETRALAVHPIGDLESFYSVETLFGSDLIKRGLKIHQKWGSDKSTFYMNDYNYYSSVASALHIDLRSKIYAMKDDPTAGEMLPCFYGGDDLLSEEIRRRRDLFLQVLSLITEDTGKDKRGKDNEETKIARFSREMNFFVDLLYIAIADVHYSQMTMADRDSVFEILRDLMKNGAPFDKDGAYPNGYDPELSSYGSVDDSHKKAMRKLYDAIIRFETADARSAEERAEIIKRYEYAALTPANREKVNAFVKQHCPNVDIERCFENIETFALLEHTRWNAYMRSEGFRTSVSKDTDNKLHWSILPLEDISVAERVKDI